MVFKDRNISTHVKSKNLISLRFVGDDGQPCTIYPLNPNGSADGIAGLCSEDGRHLAMMPHPERCALAWQCPWMPPDMRAQLTYSPWIRMFRNAFKWCVDGELQ